jgi:hypothetical protein
MTTDTTPIDITTMPELAHLAEEVEATRLPRKLVRDSETVAILIPVDHAMEKSKSQKHYKAFLAAAGSLKGMIDAEQLKRDIYESRNIRTRPLIRL